MGLVLPPVGDAGHYFRSFLQPSAEKNRVAVEQVSPYIPGVTQHEIVNPGLDLSPFTEVRVDYWLNSQRPEAEKEEVMDFLRIWLEGIGSRVSRGASRSACMGFREISSTRT